MLFTPEIQRDLGKATAVLDGDNLLVGNGHWAMVIAPAAAFLPEDLLERVFTPLEGICIDYRVLCGSHIDTEAKLFQPALAKKLQKLVVPYWGDGHKEISIEDLYQTIDKQLISGERTSLIDAFYSGKSRAVYPNKDEPKPSARFRSATADKYVFRIEDKVIVMEGGYIRGLSEMGVDLLCPTSPSEESNTPSLPGMEIYLDGDTYGINGVAMPRSDSDIMKTDCGRSLYQDAAVTCWESTVTATETIQTAEEPFHPIKYPDQVISEVNDIDAFLSQHAVIVRSQLSKAIGTLRWAGHTEDHIFKLLKDRQYDAWCEIYSKALSLTTEILSGNQIPHVYDLLQNEGVGSWPVQGAFHRLKSEATTICTTVEELSTLLGESLGHGQLPELVQQVDELEQVCGL